jgi:dTDP-4-amino-4,6-dideoxygalactose transaminase
MVIKFNDLNKQYQAIKDKVQPRLEALFENSDYINGKDVAKFEKSFAYWTGAKFAVGVSNGTDAIELCVKAIKKHGSTLYLIPNNTFIATYLGIKNGDPQAHIITIDCDEYYQMDVLDLTLTLHHNRSKYDNCVVVGVHLYGHACDVQGIQLVCKTFDCTFIEDASQAHGTMTALGPSVSIGLLSAFSLYPGKNLGALGDAGIITTNSKILKETIEKLRNFGSINKADYELDGGTNHRLDSIQAIFLDEKLKYLSGWDSRRREIAEIYDENIHQDIIRTPKVASYCLYHIYHLYVIRSQDRWGLQTRLRNNGIETGIHYPQTLEQIPILKLAEKSHRSNNYSKELLSLPMHPYMEDEEVYKVCEVINAYTG